MPDADIELIDTFCERYDLVWAIQTSDCTPVVSGLYGTVYSFDERLGKLALELVPDDFDFWPDTRAKLLRAGFDVVRDSSFEACLAFDSQNDEQCRIAVEVSGLTPVSKSDLKRRKMRAVITAARHRKAKLADAREKTRQRHCAKLGVEYYNLEERSADTRWLHCGMARLSRPAATF